MYACLCVCNTITLESLDVASSFLVWGAAWGNSDPVCIWRSSGQGQGNRSKKAGKFQFPQCKTSLGNNYCATEDRAVKFAVVWSETLVLLQDRSQTIRLGLVSCGLGVEKSHGAFRWQLRTTQCWMTTNIPVSSDNRASAGDLHQCSSVLLIDLVISKAPTCINLVTTLSATGLMWRRKNFVDWGTSWTTVFV